jgi:hypothetical protein
MTSMPSTDRHKAPWHLWVVGIIATLWSGMGVVDYLMTQTRNETYLAGFTPEQLEFFYGFPAWLVAFWAIAVWGGLLGSILLLIRRRIAVGVLLLSFLSLLVTTIHNYGFSDWLEIMGGGGSLIFSAVIFLISLLLLLYARAMSRRRVLR